MELSRDTEKAFKILFCEYKRRRKTGESKSDSLCFEDYSYYKISAFSSWLRSDIDSAIQELNRVGFLRLDILDNVFLTEKGIIYMEEKPIKFFNDLIGIFDISSIINSTLG